MCLRPVADRSTSPLGGPGCVRRRIDGRRKEKFERTDEAAAAAAVAVAVAAAPLAAAAGVCFLCSRRRRSSRSLLRLLSLPPVASCLSRGHQLLPCSAATSERERERESGSCDLKAGSMANINSSSDASDESGSSFRCQRVLQPLPRNPCLSFLFRGMTLLLVFLLLVCPSFPQP